MLCWSNTPALRHSITPILTVALFAIVALITDTGTSGFAARAGTQHQELWRGGFILSNSEVVCMVLVQKRILPA